MIVQIPIIKRKMLDDANSATPIISTEKSMMNVEVITNYKAHLKYEEQFQDKLGGDLTTLTGQIASQVKQLADGSASTTTMMNALRVLYCFVDSPIMPTFKDFVGILEPENTVEVIETLTKVLNEVGKTASKN